MWFVFFRFRGRTPHPAVHRPPLAATQSAHLKAKVLLFVGDQAAAARAAAAAARLVAPGSHPALWADAARHAKETLCDFNRWAEGGAEGGKESPSTDFYFLEWPC